MSLMGKYINVHICTPMNYWYPSSLWMGLIRILRQTYNPFSGQCTPFEVNADLAWPKGVVLAFCLNSRGTPLNLSENAGCESQNPITAEIFARAKRKRNNETPGWAALAEIMGFIEFAFELLSEKKKAEELQKKEKKNRIRAKWNVAVSVFKTPMRGGGGGLQSAERCEQLRAQDRRSHKTRHVEKRAAGQAESNCLSSQLDRWSRSREHMGPISCQRRSHTLTCHLQYVPQCWSLREHVTPEHPAAAWHAGVHVHTLGEAPNKHSDFLQTH